MIRVVDHRTIGVFLSPRMHPLSAVGRDVCLVSSILKFGLTNTPTSLDFLAPRLFLNEASPKCQRISINLTDRIFGVRMSESHDAITAEGSQRHHGGEGV
jgi:hypothetical protein